MKQSVEQKVVNYPISIWINFGCVFVALMTSLTLEVYVAFTGDVQARWFMLKIVPGIGIFSTVWLLVWLLAISEWVKQGNAQTSRIHKLAALSIPISLLILSLL